MEPRHARAQGADGRGEDRLDLLAQVDLLQLARDERRARDVGVEVDHVPQRGPLVVDVGDPPDHPRLGGQDHQPVQPPALRHGGRQEDARRRLAGDAGRLLVEDPEGVLDPPAIGQVVTRQVRARGEPLGEPPQVEVEFRRPSSLCRGRERARAAAGP